MVLPYSWQGYLVFKGDRVFCLTEDPKDSKYACEVLNAAALEADAKHG